MNICVVGFAATMAKASTLIFLSDLAESCGQLTLLDAAFAPLSEEIRDKLAIFGPLFRPAEDYRVTQDYLSVLSIAVYTWLRDKDFDLVIFVDSIGLGYFSCVARHLHLALTTTPLVVLPSLPHALQLETAQVFPACYTDFERNYLERETAKRADALIGHNLDTIAWLQSAGWPLPAQLACFDELPSATNTSLAVWLARLPSNLPKPQSLPIALSVCIATYNRPALLRESLNSLLAQTQQDFEVILVDDGSTDAGLLQIKDSFKTIFAARHWQWHAIAHCGPSAARNFAASRAGGTHLLFMDDDNLAYPNEIECFARAATSGTDILTCALGIHPDSIMGFTPLAKLPDRDHTAARPLGWLPLGNALELAPFLNRLGETNTLFRKTVFNELGGFVGDATVIFEDFTLLLKAALAGYHIETVPEILMLYRRHAGSLSVGDNIFQSHIDSLQPLANLLPPFLRPLLLQARHEWHARHQARSRQKS